LVSKLKDTLSAALV